MAEAGKLVVIEGLDGSGKATQTELLAERLAAAGRAVRVLSFPDYKSHSSALVRMYLGGEFGSDPDAVNAYAASSFYAVDRFASYAKEWGGYYRQGGLVLADRYTTSNAVHQCAKLPRGEWAGYVDWLEDYEYNKLGIPRPDLVLLLDVPTYISFRLMAERYQGGRLQDIHEADLGYLERCYEAAHWCAGRLGWRLVACCAAGEALKSKEEIAEEVYGIVNGETV